MSQFFSWVQRHGLRIVAAVALFGLSAQLAVFNAGGWANRELHLLAVLAVITEVIAFVMAVCVEGANRWYKAAICALILIGCEIFNAAGSHLAWDDSQAAKLAAERVEAQAAIDARIAALRQTIADAQGRIDAAPKPDQSTYAVRQAQQLEMWKLATEDDRAAKAKAQSQLDAIDVVAPAPAPPFADWVVWAFLGFLGFAKSLGLFAIGMSVAKPKPEAPAVIDTTNVVVIDASEAARRLVAQRKDRQKTA